MVKDKSNPGGTFDIAAYNQLLENMNQMKHTLEDHQKNNKKSIDERNQIKSRMTRLKTYVEKELKQCNCDYTKSKAILELKRMGKLIE